MSEKLAIGTDAPNFTLTDVTGKKITLSDYDRSYVILVFLRYSGCPWCNLAIHRLVFEQKLLKESKCEIITFIQSTQDDILSNIYDKHEHKPNFPVIADPRMEIYKQYSVKPSLVSTLRMVDKIPAWIHAVRKEGFSQGKIDGNLFLAPAAFLIAPYTRKIIMSEYSADLYQNETFTKYYEAIAHHQIYGFESTDDKLPPNLL